MTEIRKLTRSQNRNQYGETHLIDESQWREFLNKLPENAIIPDDFKSFMFQYNGGSFDECVFLKGERGPVVVQEFYPLQSKDHTVSIFSVRANLKGIVQEEYVTFGGDPGGNSFVIDVSPENSGKIYFWRYGVSPEETMFTLCNSFKEFIDELIVDD